MEKANGIKWWQQFRQAVRQFLNPAASIIFIEKRRSYLRAKQCICIADLSVKDQQCFSHEDECSAAGNEMMIQPVWTAACDDRYCRVLSFSDLHSIHIGAIIFRSDFTTVTQCKNDKQWYVFYVDTLPKRKAAICFLRWRIENANSSHAFFRWSGDNGSVPGFRGFWIKTAGS